MTISAAHGDLVAAPSTAGSAHLQAVAGLSSWWRARVAQAGLPDSAADLTTALSAVPPEPIPHVDDEVQSVDPWGLGAGYVETLASDVRAQFGRHYTPRDLAENLWSMTREAMGFGVDPHRLPGLLRDPAVGGGALLIAPLREHLLASVEDDPALVLNSLPNLIEGIDNDPWAVYVANVVLAAEMLPTLARVPETRRRPLPSLARVGDGISDDLQPAHSWIMNPPYGRQRLSGEQRTQFADTLYGHANLYGPEFNCASTSIGDGQPDGFIRNGLVAVNRSLNYDAADRLSGATLPSNEVGRRKTARNHQLKCDELSDDSDSQGASVIFRLGSCIDCKRVDPAR